MTDTARRTTGALFVLGAVSFGVAASVLSATFDWPDILREPADLVLPAFVAAAEHRRQHQHRHQQEPVGPGHREPGPDEPAAAVH